MQPIYLDNAATTPLTDEVRSAMLPFLGERFGNPSSRHPLGVAAGEALEAARARVARATAARPEDVFFTSGGTEANNLAVLGLARASRTDSGTSSGTNPGGHVLVGPTEHPSVAEAAEALVDEGFRVEELRLDADGELDLEDLRARLRPDTVLVAQMLVNNEFGTIYDVARVGRVVRANAPRARLHVDAIQAIGKLDVSLGELGAHSLSISAHKIHGPKGSGALVLAPGVRPRPLVFGGGQESKVRSGTENVAGVVGLGVAAELAHTTAGPAADLAASLERKLERAPGTRLLKPGKSRSPAICAVLCPGAPAEVWMHHLEARGVYTSVGSACQARKGDVPPALRALGMDEDQARHVLRISFSRETTEEELEQAVRAMIEVERELGVLG